MKISEALLDERINDNTTVVIKDECGKPFVCGRWYEDRILAWCNSEVSVDFDAERNIVILQLV